MAIADPLATSTRSVLIARLKLAFVMSSSLRHLKQPSGEPCTIVVESNNDIRKITYSEACEVVVCGGTMQERHNSYSKFYMHTPAWVIKNKKGPTLKHSHSHQQWNTIGRPSRKNCPMQREVVVRIPFITVLLIVLITITQYHIILMKAHHSKNSFSIIKRPCAQSFLQSLSAVGMASWCVMGWEWLVGSGWQWLVG